jgi:formylglycine-generating enzyme required for sulfatase activity
MGSWPGAWSNELYRAARPVERINYEDVIGHNNWPNDKSIKADSFVGRMRARTGLATFNLQTESQWENICRCGDKTSVSANKSTARYLSNQGNISDWSGDPNNGTAIVGSYKVNNWGFYDCFGNVLEMCLDAYADEGALKKLYEGLDPVVNPIGPPTHTTAMYHATRGGSFDNSTTRATSNDRYYCNSKITGMRDYRIGARFVVSQE